MPEVSWIAMLLCELATLLIGALWYSPLPFATAWQREAGVSDDALRSGSLPVLLRVSAMHLVASPIHESDPVVSPRSIKRTAA
jgi:hypothetical protein